jgi:hypothetical protein
MARYVEPQMTYTASSDNQTLRLLLSETASALLLLGSAIVMGLV